jgi:hypothetical protein
MQVIFQGKDRAVGVQKNVVWRFKYLSGRKMVAVIGSLGPVLGSLAIAAQ